MQTELAIARGITSEQCNRVTFAHMRPCELHRGRLLVDAVHERRGEFKDGIVLARSLSVSRIELRSTGISHEYERVFDLRGHARPRETRFCRRDRSARFNHETIDFDRENRSRLSF